MRLDAAILADLAVAVTLRDFVRVTRMAHAATPLGAGFAPSRFASPTGAFKVIYLAADLATAVAETLVRDRFEGGRREDRSRRRLMVEEADLWGATAVASARPLTLVDLRTTGLLRLGVSTDAARAKAQVEGRRLSDAVHRQSTADGLLYLSRLTGQPCVCLYERAVDALTATPVVPLARLERFVDALAALDVTLVAAPDAAEAGWA